MVVAFTTVMPVAATPPMVTAVAPVNCVPVMMTAVPPAIGPLAGLIAVTVGNGRVRVEPAAGERAARRRHHDIHCSRGMRRRRGRNGGGIDDRDASGGNAADGDRQWRRSSWCPVMVTAVPPADCADRPG